MRKVGKTLLMVKEALVCFALLAGIPCTLQSSQPAKGQPTKHIGVDRMYVLDCGDGKGFDESKWTPNQNIGVAVSLPDHCYLIHHTKGWFLWDTGVSDAMSSLPNHEKVFHEWGPGTGPDWRKPVTLMEQLRLLNVAATEIRFVGVSHSHPDHAGNLELFPKATLYVQRAEYEWADSRQDTIAFDKSHPVHLVDGDLDIFGDGSLVLLATPGHTPGHQSLLVRLSKTGPIILSGDAVHFETSFDHRFVPTNNWGQGETRRSMGKLADVMATQHAQLWINHDSDQNNLVQKLPGFYE